MCWAWRAKVSELALEEAEKPVSFEASDGSHVVRLGDREVTIPDTDFVEAVTARLPKDYAMDGELREALRALA